MHLTGKLSPPDSPGWHLCFRCAYRRTQPGNLYENLLRYHPCGPNTFAAPTHRCTVVAILSCKVSTRMACTTLRQLVNPSPSPSPCRVYLVERGAHLALREPLRLHTVEEEGHHCLLETLKLRHRIVQRMVQAQHVRHRVALQV